MTHRHRSQLANSEPARGAVAAPVARAVLGIALGSLLGCASGLASGRPSCRAGETAVVSDALYFGTARREGAVTPQQWSSFVADQIAPRFPAGFTSWEAAGQWQGPSGRVDREASHIVLVVHPEDEASERAIAMIMRAYRTSFEQDAVLRIRSYGCSSTRG